jgi:TPR repeat protein
MKMKWCMTVFLLFVLCAGVQLRAQPNDTNSIESIKAAAEKGDPRAQSILAWKFENGEGVLQNYDEAIKWYIKAANQTGIYAQRAQFNLASDYFNGIGVAQDKVEAVKWYRKAAEQNFALAQVVMGYCYQFGRGVSMDEAEAVKWYRKAADQNDACAQNNLGLCYCTGQGVPQDYAEAVKWFRKAAEQDHADGQYNLNADGQYNLGFSYEKGEGVPQDYIEAVKWYRKSAEQGNAAAEFSLGTMYVKGQGVPQDYNEALKWETKSANRGNARAQCILGLMFEKGQGVPQDYMKAVTWYRRASEQGDKNSQTLLGVMYQDGKGVTQDYIEAYKWYNLAAAQGASSVSEGRDSLALLMTPSQIAEGQRLAREFVPRKETPDSYSSSTTPVAADSPIATGTGFFITGDGYLISNYHVVKDATKVRLLTSAGFIDAKVVQVDAVNDLALLKADGRFALLPIAASRTVNLGGTVATVGFPNIGLQGFAPKLAKGEIASLSGAADDPRYFQISVPVQPGNSGGALVDERGNVIGIVSAKLDASVALAASGALPENVNYAVKSSLLLSFLESVPAVSAKLKAPNTADEKFSDVVKSAQSAAVLVLVY